MPSEIKEREATESHEGEHEGAESQADKEKSEKLFKGKGSSGGDKSPADKKKQTIIAGATVASVIVGYMLYRSYKNNASTATPATTTGTTTDGGNSGSGQGYDSGTLSTAIAGLTAQEAANANTLASQEAADTAASQGQIAGLQGTLSSMAKKLTTVTNQLNLTNKNLGTANKKAATESKQISGLSKQLSALRKGQTTGKPAAHPTTTKKTTATNSNQKVASLVKVSNIKNLQ